MSCSRLMRDEVDVEPGDQVECGDRLGLIASSGRSSAPHLHFDVTREGLDAWVDPFDAGSGESLWVEPSLPGLLPGAVCE
ncbi:MAG: M23 family metallopeptidase [Gammaproteobacteria bacterium]